VDYTYLGHGTEPSVSIIRLRSGPVREHLSLYISGAAQSMCWPVLATELQKSDTSTHWHTREMRGNVGMCVEP
jgi:hypothetical protein